MERRLFFELKFPELSVKRLNKNDNGVGKGLARVLTRENRNSSPLF